MRLDHRLVVVAFAACLAVLACSGEDNPSGGAGSGVGNGASAGAAGSGSLGVGGRSGQGGSGGAPGPAFVFENEQTTAFFGSTSGTAAPGARCKADEVLVGASFKQDPGGLYSGSLFGLHPICAALSQAAGALTMAPGVVSEESMGGSGVAADVVEARCPAGHAVTQMDVWRLNVMEGVPGYNIAFDLVLTCNALTLEDGRVVTGAPAPATTTSQKGVQSAGIAACGAGTIALGFDGLYGSEVDQVGLVCASLRTAAQ